MSNPQLCETTATFMIAVPLEVESPPVSRALEELLRRWELMPSVAGVLFRFEYGRVSKSMCDCTAETGQNYKASIVD
jgi:hypothetical protein